MYQLITVDNINHVIQRKPDQTAVSFPLIYGNPNIQGFKIVVENGEDVFDLDGNLIPKNDVLQFINLAEGNTPLPPDEPEAA